MFEQILTISNNMINENHILLTVFIKESFKSE